MLLKHQVAEMHDNRIAFIACAFMHKVFIFGGDIGGSISNSCLEFDTRDYSWKDVSGMNNARWVAACAVFKDKIVVSGGIDNNYNSLNTVESYDFISSVSYKRLNQVENVYNNILE